MKKIFVISFVIFSNISSMNYDNREINSQTSDYRALNTDQYNSYPALPNQNLFIAHSPQPVALYAMPTPPQVLAPWQIEQAKKLAVQVINEFLSKKDKIITCENLLVIAKEIIASNLQKLDSKKTVNWQLKQQVEQFVEKLNKKLFENFQKHRNVKTPKDFEIFWNELRQDLCKSFKVDYDKNFVQLTKNLPMLAMKDLKKLQLAAKQAKLINSSYSNNRKKWMIIGSIELTQFCIVCGLVISWIFYDALSPVNFSESDTIDGTLEWFLGSALPTISLLSEIPIIACFALIIAKGKYDTENISDFDELLKNIKEAIINFPDTNIFDENDDPIITEITETVGTETV